MPRFCPSPLLRTVGLAVLIASLSSTLSAQATAVLTVQDADWPPYYFGGQGLDGFAKEVLEHCLPAGGHSFEFVPYPIVRMFQYLRDGQIDLHVVSRNTERESFLHYGSEPLFESSYRPILSSSNTASIETLSDLDELRLGVIRGIDYVDWYQDYLTERDEAGTLEWAPNNLSVLRMLLAGRIDAFVNTVATSRWLAESLDAGDQIRVVDLDIKTSSYFVVISKASTTIRDPQEYLDRVDRCIAEFKKRPEYQQLERRYHIH